MEIVELYKLLNDEKINVHEFEEELATELNKNLESGLIVVEAVPANSDKSYGILMLPEYTPVKDKINCVLHIDTTKDKFIPYLADLSSLTFSMIQKYHKFSFKLFNFINEHNGVETSLSECLEFYLDLVIEELTKLVPERIIELETNGLISLSELKNIKLAIETGNASFKEISDYIESHHVFPSVGFVYSLFYKINNNLKGLEDLKEKNTKNTVMNSLNINSISKTIFKDYTKDDPQSIIDKY